MQFLEPLTRDRLISRRDFVISGAVAAAVPDWHPVDLDSHGEIDAKLNLFFETMYQRDLAKRMRGLQHNKASVSAQWPDIGEARAAQDMALVQKDLANLREFDRSRLSPAAKLDFDVFSHNAMERIERYRWRNNHYHVCQMRGPQREVPHTLINDCAIRDTEGAVIYIERILGVRDYIMRVISALKRQKRLGITPPLFSAKLVIHSCRQLIRGVPFDSENFDSPILADFRVKIAKLSVSETEKDKLIVGAVRALVGSFGPGFRVLMDYLGDAGLRGGHNDGVWRLPDGGAYYEAQLRWNTTLGLSSADIHRIGLEECNRIHAEILATANNAGFYGDIDQLFNYLRSENDFYFAGDAVGKAAYLEAMTSTIADVNARVGDITTFKPSTPITVKPVEPWLEASAGIAGYFPPKDGSSRSAILYVNTSDMRRLPKFELSSLAYHEGVPGHHLEQSITRTLPHLPTFRKFGSYTAYSEGWALYAEQIPLDLGLYTDPWHKLGRLSLELMRAGRLVADTGLHALRWDQDRAVAWLNKNTPSTPAANLTSVQRYIVTPGQACAYQIGKMKISELRSRAQTQLGERFDVRRFHDRLLGSGQLPMSLLSDHIAEWIALENSR